MAEAMNIPIAADLLSKSAVPENHPLYIGVYGGAMSSDPFVRKYVEGADFVLMLGTFITDMNMGIYTAKLDPAKSVLATTESIKLRYHRYDDVQFPDYLAALEMACRRETPKKFKPHPQPVHKPLVKAEMQTPLSMADVFRIVSLHLDEHCCVVSDVGDAIFGAVGIRTARRAEFIAPAYYLSMGFAVPASIGVAMGNPNLRPIVLVGDGAFQMTGTELSTIVRLGLNPIILILNNDGYGTMRKIRDGSFNIITRWHYGKICELVGGGETSVAATRGQLDGAIRAAFGSKQVHVIDVRIPRDDISPQLANMTAEVARIRGTKKSIG
jgi:indolepyruvate decarboxylase